MSQTDKLPAQTPTASIIVPVYNAQRTLKRCLDSLAAQQGVQLEFICLDDGSTDSSLDILRIYEAKDDRFKVVAKSNEGYGATINRGIARATGDYVGIVESDDAVGQGCYEKLLALAKQNGMPDIVKANHYRVIDGQEHFAENYPVDVCGRLITGDDPAWDKLVVSTPAIWAALYRRGFLKQNGITCLETPGAAYQDTGFVMKSWISAQTAVIDHDGYYRYTTLGEGSSSASGGNPDAVLAEWASIDEFACATEQRIVRRGQLMGALAAKRFQTYWWNLRRIKRELRCEFAEKARMELMALQEVGAWENTTLSPSEHKTLEKWMNDYEALLLDLHIAETKRTKGRLAAMPFKVLRAIR